MTTNPWPAPHAHGPVHATVVVPGSKSETNRALVLAALASGPSTITGGLLSRDSDLMRAALGQLGVDITVQPDGSWRVTPPPRFAVPAEPIDCGLAGTVMRFVPPIAALNGGETTFVGDPHASQRPMAPLLEALTQLGVTVSDRALPFTLQADTLRGRRVVIDSSGSSQFVSALLLAGARLPEGIEVAHQPAEPGASVPSRPHIDMTVQMLRERGVEVVVADESTWLVEPGTIAPLDTHIEPDLTNAAVFLAAAALTGGEVTVPGWPEQTTQGGAAILDILDRMRTPDGLTAPGTVDLHASSELTPVVAALAALVEGETTITGVAHIRGHETDRLAALTAELGRIGADVTETADGLRIIGRGPDALHGATWGAYADHRMAHAGALVGLLVDGIVVDDIGCTTKTITDFPGLWNGMLEGSR